MNLNEGFTMLAGAIVLQAVKDYRKAQEVLVMNPKSCIALENKAEIDRFFHSNWFLTLCNLNDVIEGMLDKEGIDYEC